MNLLVPVSWLRDFLKTDVTAKTLAREMSLRGPSIDRIEKKGDDYIFDVEVTSNRVDTFSIFGIAREANAILTASGEKSKLVGIDGINQKLEPDTQSRLKLDVLIKDQKLCPRFTAIVLDNVRISPPPAFVKNRLEAVGIRSINNIVDLTNYIMTETGQPMHAFDFDKIAGSRMTLRPSKLGETITTLDGQRRKLPAGAIVIEDQKRLIDLAGIMGAENSQITRRTKRVAFFVQSYDPLTIRRTTQSLAFRTDAAIRFEKGVDEETIVDVLRRAVFLAKKISGAKIASELIDIYPKKQKNANIKLVISKLNKYLGIEIPQTKSVTILSSLGFKVQTNATQLIAKVPSWRTKDVAGDVDLIEEIARIYGYHNLPSTLPSGEIPKTQQSDLKQVIELKKALKYLGLTEILTYSIISKEMLKITEVEEKNAVELTNPLTEEWQFMRPTLIPSLLDVVKKNQNIKENIKIFEIAKTYEKSLNALPTQNLKISIVLQNSNFSEIKGYAESFFEITKREPKFQKLSHSSPLLDEHQSALVKIGDQIVGELGMIKLQVADHFSLDYNTAIAEINLTTCYQQPVTSNQYRSIPKYPPVIEDISAIFSVFTPVADIITEIKKASSLVKKIEVIDIFMEEKLGIDKKSVTLSLTYQKPAQTPSQNEVTTERVKISSALEKNLRAKIRK